MSDVINFQQSAEWLIDRSKFWGKRGDYHKSLLYARRAYDLGGIDGKLRLAKALYESGNFVRAFEEYMKMYRGELHNEEVCVGLIKCLSGMSFNRTMGYIMMDAVKEGVLQTGKAAVKVGNFRQALADIFSAYPDESEDKEFTKIAFLYFAKLVDEPEVLLREISLTEDIMSGGMDSIIAASSIPTLKRLNDELAEKSLMTCESVMSEDNYNAYEVLSIKIVCLIYFDRIDEAYDAADELLDYPFPEDSISLLKCANAFMVLGKNDAELDYLEELTVDSHDERLLLYTAIANMNDKCYDMATDLFSQVLTINPSNLVAKHWLNALNEAKDEPAIKKRNLCSPLFNHFPPKLEADKRSIIDAYFDEVERTGKANETDEMRELIRYVLEDGSDFEFTAYAARRMAALGVFEDLCEWYLCNPVGALSIKRDIMFELFCRDRTRTVPVLSRGLRGERVEMNLDGVPEPLLRAYLCTLSTMLVFIPDDSKKLNNLFATIYPLLERFELKTESDIMSLAASLLYIGFYQVDTQITASGMFLMSRTSRVAQYCKAIISEYPQYSRVSRKRK